MNWTVVGVCVGLAVIFKVWMIRKFGQWMRRDRLARMADGDPARLEALTARLESLEADRVPKAERWARLEAWAADPAPPDL